MFTVLDMLPAYDRQIDGYAVRSYYVIAAAMLSRVQQLSTIRERTLESLC